MPANVHRPGDYAANNNAQPNRQAMPNAFGANQGNAQAGPNTRIVSIGPGGDDGGNSMFPKLSRLLAPNFNTKSFIFWVSMFQILVFVAELVVGAAVQWKSQMDRGAFVKTNPMAGPGTCTFLAMGAKDVALIQDGQVFRLITPVFLHGGIQHIFFNLFFQFNLCFTYEKLWGTRRIIFLYFATGLGATLLSSVSSCAPSVGASGALFGMLGAQISYLIMNWYDIPTPPGPRMQMCNLVLIIMINFMMGGLGSAAQGAASDTPGAVPQANIDEMAHLGGLITGLFMGCAFVVSTSTWTEESCCPVGKERMFKLIGLGLTLVWFATLLSVTFFVAECTTSWQGCVGS